MKMIVGDEKECEDKGDKMIVGDEKEGEDYDDLEKEEEK